MESHTLPRKRANLPTGDELLLMIITWWFGEGRSSTAISTGPLIYATFSNCTRILLPERHRLTFVACNAAPGVSPRELVTRIQCRTNLKHVPRKTSKADTVRWYLIKL